MIQSGGSLREGRNAGGLFELFGRRPRLHIEDAQTRVRIGATEAKRTIFALLVRNGQ
jgi:hypothetical protein